MQPQSDNNNKSKSRINTNQQEQKYCNQHQQQQLRIHLPGTLSSPPTETTKASASATRSFTSNKETIISKTTIQAQKQQNNQFVQVIKCKKPLCHFKFFVDLNDQQLTKRIEELIQFLGGSLEFVLSDNVTHFITDKTVLPPPLHNKFSNNNSNNNCPDTPKFTVVTPSTPGTPETPYSIQSLQQCNHNKTKNGFKSIYYSTDNTEKSATADRRQSRANVLLNRARQNQSANNSKISENQRSLSCLNNQLPHLYSTTPTQLQSTTTPSSQPYVVWQANYALSFFKKVQHELQEYLDLPRKQSTKLYRSNSGSKDPIHLKHSFIKIEAIKHNCRPYYQLFKKPNEWPKICLTLDDGVFRLSSKRKNPKAEEITKSKVTKLLDTNTMTRKSQSRSSSNQKNGVQMVKKSSISVQRNNGSDIGSGSGSNSNLKNGASSTICKTQHQQKQQETTDKQCGVCEICKIEYDTLTIHLKTKSHEYFAKNPQNFIGLDTLIHTTADVNKFLEENRKIKIKRETEDDVEMATERINEVSHHTSNGHGMTADVNVNNVGSSNNSNGRKKSLVSSGIQNVNGTNILVNTSSPTPLREKSKRTTKGKHSSEKFQNIIKSPKIPSPIKSVVSVASVSRITTLQSTHHVTSTPILENTLKRNKNCKKTALSVISPPLRAVLPQSPLYKVVETHTDVSYTTPREGTRNGRRATGAVASPSIIVKFKKVRCTELQVLNGEAESFMFPKRCIESSDISTDVDRHTTSDRLDNTTSSSLNSSTGWLNLTGNDVCESTRNSLSTSFEKVEESDRITLRKTETTKERNKINTAKRKTINSCSLTLPFKQIFPSAPIQPEQQKQQQQMKSSTTATQKKLANTTAATKGTNTKIINNVANSAIVETTAAISLPEATRKSTRMATAIVTAATTSSRLLQAAVEAAKSRNRSDKSVVTIAPKEKVPKKLKKVHKEENVDVINRKEKRMCRRNVVVKLEDRMGEQKINIKKKQQLLSLPNVEDEDEDEDIDFDDYDDATVDNDDTKDEDFVLGTTKKKTKSAKKAKIKCNSSTKKPTSREQRASRREKRSIEKKCIKTEPVSDMEIKEELFDKSIVATTSISNINIKNKSRKTSQLNRVLKKTSASTAKKLNSRKKQKQQQQLQASRLFDFMKSERLKNYRYAFERLPETDLWYRVYMRQDKCEEKYYEYFGSNTYRKLPYELGPMPFTLTTITQSSNGSIQSCCKLCQKTENSVTNIMKESHCNQKPLNQENLIALVKRSEEDKECKPLIKDASENTTALLTTVINNNNNPKMLSENCSKPALQYTHKHKKLHLLQRYREEQELEALLQKQQQQQQQQEQLQQQQQQRQYYEQHTEKQITENVNIDTVTSVNAVSSLGYLREYRAPSTNSNASSYTSSSTIGKRTRNIFNKNLNKASFLANLELPPRKSPREHASTLALVSCIIKQRQDSMSKPNSEIDEPSAPATFIETKQQQLVNPGKNEIVETTFVTDVRTQSISEIIKPVIQEEEKEVRFATEISETVKRMRRGRNKYDYSPPFVARKQNRLRGGGTRDRGAVNCVVETLAPSITPAWNGRLSTSNNTSTTLRSQTPSAKQQKQTILSAPVVKKCRNSVTKGNSDALTTGAVGGRNQNKGYFSATLPSVRKTGSKKGVLEFEMDDGALKALKSFVCENRPVPTPQQLEWQIDKYLTYAGQQYDLDIDILEDKKSLSDQKEIDLLNRINNTPPPTDYFSSDFDLYDLLNSKLKQDLTPLRNTHETVGTYEKSACLDNKDYGRCSGFSEESKINLFNTTALHNYFRRRKTLKTNRTGWPKANKKKIALSRSQQEQQQQIQQKIYFLQNKNINQQEALQEIKSISTRLNESHSKTKFCEEGTNSNQRHRVVITLPDSGTETRTMAESITSAHISDALNVESQTVLMDDDDNDDIDTVVDFMDHETYAADADCEEIDEDDDNDLKEVDEDDDDGEEKQEKEKRQRRVELKRLSILSEQSSTIYRHRHCTNESFEGHEPSEKRMPCFELLSPVEKTRSGLVNSHTYTTGGCSSTPTQHLMRTLRCTPQLNGSLGSCISPSEKAGDNSDIFTVSSDGLDTDLDLSNSHTHSHQLKMTDDDSRHNVLYHHHNHNHYHHNQYHNHQYCHDGMYQTTPNSNTTANTPKRKFDLSKYAPKAGATCAAEAATAAVKSLAISQFLKKEVRVTCRRLRAPFRRFRYRR